ncbi:LPXTG cell wall anchor domain-containing protein [Brochothrix thermosphacta]|uniref:Gram-positive cocci surface proteins LPxTG domain-containing protein n=1 Tax=Brochothrix thermosphacta TaxID=2756 RepID=A0A2X0SAL7_BROTH|nr:LPXTG cell wall anchor domain-containing protein [Brochothrix thermosphacta]ODJ58640.1 hypothetical protein BFR44_06230 [Brochothrix thermosphacta]SPP28921.1 conserved exported hypothetical protein [Brochothrix thermosphacta]
MYKKLVIILPLLMLAFMLCSAQLSKAAETQSYNSNAVTGFYGEYVFEDGTSNNDNNGNNNNSNNSNTGSNNTDGNNGLGSIPSGKLPVTGDSNGLLPIVGSLLIAGVTLLFFRRKVVFQEKCI